VMRKFVILPLILLVFTLAGCDKFKGNQIPENTPLPTENPAEVLASPVPSPTEKPLPPKDDLGDLTKALIAKTGIPEGEIDVTLSSGVQGNYAKGLVGTKGEETGGGYFLAYKTSGKWIIAYDGQATPDCKDVEVPGFPKAMVPECMQSGNVVTR